MPHPSPAKSKPKQSLKVEKPVREAGAERCSQPEKFIVTHFSLAQGPRTAGAAYVPLEEPLHGETMTSSSPTRETWGGGNGGQCPGSVCRGPGDQPAPDETMCKETQHRLHARSTVLGSGGRKSTMGQPLTGVLGTLRTTGATPTLSPAGWF